MKAFQLKPFLVRNNSANIFLHRSVAGYFLFIMLLVLSTIPLSIISYTSTLLFLAIRVIQLANFIAIGILNAALIERRPFFTRYTRKERLYLTFALTLAVYATLLSPSFILGASMQRMAFAGSCAFLLPMMLMQAWHYYFTIPESRSMVWCDYKLIAENANIAYLNTIRIHLKVSKKYLGNKETSFFINAPLKTDVGKIFNTFLNVEIKRSASDIECIDQSGTPFGWKFFIVRFGGFYKRVLDPSKSLKNNNNIMRNAIILVKRVKLS